MTLNLLGKQFRYLTVLEKLPDRDYLGRTVWKCKCECGNIKNYETYRLTDKKKGRQVETCGACQDHVKRKDAYVSWMAAKSRCRNENDKDYSRYGAVGILFSPLWDKFKEFYKELGDPPWDDLYQERYSLDRVNNSKGYEPGNCKWSTRTEQANNRSDNTGLGGWKS